MKKLADGFDVAGRLVPELSEEVINQVTAYAIRHRRLRAADQEKFKEQLRGNLEQNLDHDKIDDAAYHDSRGVSAPIGGGELGAMVGGNVAVGSALTALQNRSGRNKAKLTGTTFHPESMRADKLLTRSFGPAALIPSAAFETAGIALAPMSDPLYRRGTRSYLSSVGKGFEGKLDSMEAREKETRDRYGLAGLPVQAFHGLLNPISSIGYAARSGKNFLMGKQGEALVRVAESAISKALEA